MKKSLLLLLLLTLVIATDASAQTYATHNVVDLLWWIRR